MAFTVSLISACSNLYKAEDPNILSTKPIVPATLPAPATLPEKTSPPDNAAPGSKTKSPVKEHIPAPEIPSSTEQAPTKEQAQTDVLSSVLQQAEKAIESQQWLRAQHHLEHALRIAPHHAKTYYLYSMVYDGLKVPVQSNNMLKRALFLSKPGSELHQEIKSRLQEKQP